MEISDKLKEFMGIAGEEMTAYGERVVSRVTHPLETLAKALKEGMPTEENPLGMFGIAGITHGVITTKIGTKFSEQSDNTWTDGEHTFESLGDLIKGLPELTKGKPVVEKSPVVKGGPTDWSTKNLLPKLEDLPPQFSKEVQDARIAKEKP